MGIEKLTKKRRSLFGRLTNKFITQPIPQSCSKRDQSVQTSLNISQTSSQLTATILVNSRMRQRTCSPNSSIDNSKNTPHTRRRRRSSLKAFIVSHSPKPIPLIARTRRRSVDLKTPKRLSSEGLQVALIRKIQPINRYGSPLALSSTTSNIISVTRQKQCFPSPRESFDYPTMSHYSYMRPCQQLFHDETTSRDDLFSIGPMKWSTPNRTVVYKTSSPYNNNFDHQRRLCTVDQLSFSNILDRSD